MVKIMRKYYPYFSITICACLFIILFFPFLVESQQESRVELKTPNAKGIIKGKILNKSGNITPVPEHEVKLTIHSRELEQDQMEEPSGTTSTPPSVISRVTKSDKEGAFVFRDLVVGQEINYMITTEFEGVKYFGGVIQLKENQPEVGTELNVYETTSEQPEILVNREHSIANMAGDSIYITEVLIIENRGSKTFFRGQAASSGKEGTFRISLPKGFDQVQYFRGLSEESAANSESGIEFLDPIKPGMMQIVYGYRLPGKEIGYQWTKVFDYDTLSLDVLFLDSGVSIKSDKLQKGDSVQLNDRNYLRLTGSDIRRGEKVKISIALEKSVAGQSSLKWAIIGIVVVIIAAAFSYGFLKRQAETRIKSPEVNGSEASSEKRFTELETERTELIKAIADLDDRLADQLISQPQYQESRDRKKERLIEVTKLLSKA